MGFVGWEERLAGRPESQEPSESTEARDWLRSAVEGGSGVGAWARVMSSR